MLERHIFLIGMPGCGKSSLGKKVASITRVPYVDTDQRITDAVGCSVSDMFERYGEGAFRNAETNVLIQLTREQPSLVSTGGGMVLTEDNRRFLRAAGEVIFLQAPADTLAERLTRNALPSQRPSLTGGDMVQEVAAVLAERLPLYKAAAHHWVDATQPVQRLCALLQRLCPPQNGRSDS